MEFDHAGIATEDADALVSLYGDAFGLGVAHEETLGDLRVVFLDCGNGYFELLEPLAGEETVSRYLDRQGAGVHHLALRTGDIEGALDLAREHGVTPIDEEPRAGAWGHRVAFLHPSSTGGVLLEFVEH